jgi:transcriptional regulator with XRE-family HTH domain
MRASPLCITAQDMADFAERLKQLRTERQLTQGRLSELIGVSVRVYHRWENGDATPHLDTLVKIADVLGVSADALLGRSEVAAEQRIHNHELHRLYREVDQLADEDQQALLVVIDSLLKRAKFRRVMADESAPSRRRTAAKKPASR